MNTNQTEDFDALAHDENDEFDYEALAIEVNSQPIELYKLFKIANLVSAGGEAKHIIEQGYVAVNGELETRKRRKMYHNDFFQFNQEYYVVICDAPVTQTSSKKPKSNANTASLKKSNLGKSLSEPAKKSSKSRPHHSSKSPTQTTKRKKANDDKQSSRGIDAISGRAAISFGG